MAQYAQQAAQAGDRYLAALATTQDRFVDSLAALRPWIVSMNPAAATAVRATQQFNEANFAFALKLLEQQHGFFAKLLALQSRTRRADGGSVTLDAPEAGGSASRTSAAPRATAKRRTTKKKQSGKQT